MKYPFQPAEEIGKGYFVTRQVIGGRFTPNFATLLQAREEAAFMNANEPEYLVEIIEAEIMRYTDWTGLSAPGVLAQRIAGEVTKAYLGRS